MEDVFDENNEDSKFFMKSDDIPEVIMSLSELIQIEGVKSKEKPILDYIEKEILENIKPEIFRRDDEYGIYVVIPCKSGNPKRTILFDANVDTERDKDKKFQILEVGFDAKRELGFQVIFHEQILFDNHRYSVQGNTSGLDNRVGVSILLHMIKKIRFEDIQFVALFSTKKKWGRLGVEYFSNNIDLKELHGIEVSKIIVFDTTSVTQMTEMKNVYYGACAIMGKGFLPIFQDINEYDGNYLKKSNVMGFHNGLYTSNISCVMLAIPIFLSQTMNYVSKSDIFSLIHWIDQDFEKLLEKNENLIEEKITNQTPFLTSEEQIPIIEEKKKTLLKKEGEFLLPPLSIKPKNERQEYLFSTLLKLLVMYGPTDEEFKVLEFVKNEIPSDIKIVCEDYYNYGLYCIIPPLNNNKSKRTLIFDAHIDTVQIEYIKPFIYEQNINDKQRQMIIATGLDNRIHCAILLSLIKYVRYEDTQIIVLFTVHEEGGCRGAEYFCNNINLKEKHGIEDLQSVIVLDVSTSILFEDISESGEYKPFIGGGVIPNDQAFSDYNFMGCCNSRRFTSGKYTKHLNCYRYSVGCTRMHFRESFASVSDMYDLFDWLENDLFLETLEKDKGKSHCVVGFCDDNDEVLVNIKEEVEGEEIKE